LRSRPDEHLSFHNRLSMSPLVFQNFRQKMFPIDILVQVQWNSLTLTNLNPFRLVANCPDIFCSFSSSPMLWISPFLLPKMLQPTLSKFSNKPTKITGQMIILDQSDDLISKPAWVFLITIVDVIFVQAPTFGFTNLSISKGAISALARVVSWFICALWKFRNWIFAIYNSKVPRTVPWHLCDSHQG